MHMVLKAILLFAAEK